MRARCGTRCARMEVAPRLIIYGSVGPGPPGPFICAPFSTSDALSLHAPSAFRRLGARRPLKWRKVVLFDDAACAPIFDGLTAALKASPPLTHWNNSKK